MNNFLDYDYYQSRLYQKNLDKNYIEIIDNFIFQTNTNHQKSILCFHDETTGNHERSYENIVSYYYYKNNCQNIDIIAEKYLEVWEGLEKDFFEINNEHLPADTYNSIKGSDWPDYSDYVQNNFSFDKNISEEILKFESEYLENIKNNKISDIKEYVAEKLLVFQKRDYFLETLDKNNTVIYALTKIIHEYLNSKNFKCFLLPISHAGLPVIESIPNLKTERKHKKQYSYFLLNRKFKRERNKTIQELSKNNLLQHGYVTHNSLPFDSKNLKIKFENVKYKNDLSVFNKKPEDVNYMYKITSSYNGIPCNKIYKNTLEIGEKINSLIQISIESDLSENFITEKAFQPFLLKRIPLIIAHPESIAHLKNHGFDLFEDIVDLSFNNIEDIDLKIETAIKNNADLLSTYSILGIEDRLENNLNLLLKTFPSNYLEYVNAKINELF